MLQLYDLAGIYYRAYYALPSSITAPSGAPVNAIRGSLDMLARLIAEARPARAVACLDVDWRPGWRVALVPSYKTHRVAMTEPADSPPAATAQAGVIEEAPDDLAPQIRVLLDVLRALGLALAGADECEADDVIATLCSAETTDPVEVVSGDRDLFQLVRSAPTPVSVRYIGAGMNKAETVDAAGLRDRYGVDGPGYAAAATLRGDPSDGLPGVPGIGQKTATRLVTDFGTIAGIVAAAEAGAPGLSPALRRRIDESRAYLTSAEQVVLTRQDADVRIEAPRAAAEADRLPEVPADPAALDALAAEYGLRSPIDRLSGAIRAAHGNAHAS